MSTASRHRLWVVTEPYYPEQISTGYFLTGIAECLAGVRDVGVICSMRVAPDARDRLARNESHRGVDVYRAGLRFGYPRSLPARLFVEGWMAVAMWWRALRLVRRGDEMLVVTNPPFLPFLMRFVAWLRGAEFDLLIHDVYPEVLAITGVVRDGGLAFRLLDGMTQQLYRGCRRIIVLSEGVRARVSAKLGERSVPVHVVPNWGDVERIRPKARAEVELLRELGIGDRFVLQYSGNIGRTHGVELLIEVAERMQRAGEEVFFLIIGAGSRKRKLERAARDLALDNVRFLDRQPDDKFADSINACDLAVVMLQQGMGGISVPSRLYNLLAAGRPLLVVADADTEPARVVQRESLGWVVPPGDARGVREAILAAREAPEQLALISARARSLAEGKYGYAAVRKLYAELYR